MKSGFIKIFSVSIILLISNVFAEDITLYKEYKSQFSPSDFKSNKSTICPTTFSWACMGPPCGMHGCTFYSGTIKKDKPKADQLDASFFTSLNHFNKTLQDSYKVRLTAYQDNLRQQYMNQVSSLKEIKTEYAKNFAITEHGNTVADQEYIEKRRHDEFMQELHDMLVVNKVDAFLKINENDSEYSVNTIDTLAAHLSLNNSCKIYKFTRNIKSLNPHRNTAIVSNASDLYEIGVIKKQNTQKKNLTSVVEYEFTNSGGLDYDSFNEFLSVSSLHSIANETLKNFYIPENKKITYDFNQNRRKIISANLYADYNIDGYVALSANALANNELLQSENSILEGIELKLSALLSRRTVINTSFRRINQ